MKRPVNKKERIRAKRSIYNEVDTHRWATKMEIQRLIGGKPDLKLKGMD
jgi:hypothetical protein